MNRKLLFAISISVVLATSCKKSDDPGPGGGGPPLRDKVKDSAVDIARDIYLWYTQIPTGFNGQSYADPDKIMAAIRQYSKEPGFTNAVDRWSFAAKKSDWDDISGGISQDFGLSVFFLEEGDLRVKYVEKASPAGVAGLRRGWRITKINGSTNITTSNADFIVDAVFYSASTSFTFLKPDGTSVDITLTAATYQDNPFFLDTVYTAGASKAGYIVFNSFLGDTAAINNKLQAIFTRFATEGVNDIIVDLRYNGGGYVSIQQKFANYLINTAGNGGVMMSQKFNDQYSIYDETENFSKLGTMNLSRIFFIVSNNTASASELLINNLRPYMTVKLVGPSSTYGKPVGYFPIPVGDWYVFPVSFRSTNKNNEGNYFSGFAPDKIVADGLTKDWGDKTEGPLASILTYLSTGTFGLNMQNGREVAGKTDEMRQFNEKLSQKEFKGAVLNRRF